MKTNELGTKIFSSRSSATANLKKIGIQKEEYDRFIIKGKDGKFSVDLQLAERYLRQLEAEVLAKKAKSLPKPAETAVTGPTETLTPSSTLEKLAANGKAKAAAAASLPAKNDKTKSVSVGSVARELILSGLSNADVFVKLDEQFHIGVGKKSYPAWYRADMKRKGLLK